jgi:hypothetical protein
VTVMEGMQPCGDAEKRSNPQTVSCDLIVTRADTSQFLLAVEHGQFQLPRAHIPLRERAAPHLIAHVRRQLNLETICRFGEPSAWLSCPSGPRYYVLETVENGHTPSAGHSWVSASSIEWRECMSKENLETLDQALAQATGYDRAEVAPTFVRSGWFQEVRNWVAPGLEEKGLRLEGQWEQYNMGPYFCLLRFRTSGPAVWFKAVGEPNLREYAITAALARLHTSFLPRILATHSGWNAWLMADAAGNHLDELPDLRYWLIAAKSMAALQQESIANTSQLLAAGCEDLRLFRLKVRIDPFFEMIAELMRFQAVKQPSPLTTDQLNFTRQRLDDACSALETMGFPDTLGQSDLNPGNVIVDDESASFIDWADASVGFPFTTFEYLLAVFRRQMPDRNEWITAMCQSYFEPWRESFSSATLASGFILTPLVAAFAFAVSYPNWRLGTRIAHPNGQNLLRSLARRMFTEALKLESNAL